jgi:hypothetical protein
MTKQQFQQTLEEVLRQPSYQKIQKGYMHPIDQIKQFLMDHFIALLERIGQHSYRSNKDVDIAGSPIWNTLLVIAIILIVLLIITILFMIRKTVLKETKSGSKWDALKSGKATAEQFIEQGKELANKGVFREAIHYQFIALLWKMNEKNLLYLDEAKTNGEMLRTLRKKKFVYIGVFEKLILCFNDTWDGPRPMEAVGYDTWQQEFDTLWQGVERYESSEKN